MIKWKSLKPKSRVVAVRRSPGQWHEIGGKRYFFRSHWEIRFAKFLEFQKKLNLIKDWEHEPKTFWFESIKRGCRSYKPDFHVLLEFGDHYWVEVKGHYDSKSLTKIKRFKRFFPKEELRVVDKEWFYSNPGF